MESDLTLGFTGERIVPGAIDCEPTFAQKMYQEHLARYAFAAQFASGASVLDVGCGVGYGTQWLAKAGAKSVLGFDVSEEAIEHARRHYFHPAASYKVEDATAIEPGDGYDLVTCFELIEHIAQQERVLDLIKVALRKDGILVISTPRPHAELRTHFHVHEMNFEELHRMLKQRFRHVEPYFEVNCFTSFVGNNLPERIEHIVPVTDRIDIDHADYFLFVASDREIIQTTPIRPLLTMNDDSYVLNLEHDVDILRRAENDHIARIAHLEHEKAELTNAYTAAEQRSNAIDQIRQALEHLSGQVAQQATYQAEYDALRSQIMSLRNELTESKALQNELRCAADAELYAVRQQMAATGEQLATAQTEAFSLRGNTERLHEVQARATALENELNALRYRFEQSEATLARFRGSVSWTITRPVRWVGRSYNKMIGRKTA